MKIQHLSLALVAIAIVGCRGGDGNGYTPVPPSKLEPVSVKPGQEATLMPIAVGNQWTYNVETIIATQKGKAQRKGELTFKITKVDDTSNGKRATIDILSSGKVTERQIWLVNDKGIYQVSTGVAKPVTYSTPIPLILFPVDKNKTFKWKGSGGPYQRSIDAKILENQEVDTDEKRYSAIGVETKGENKDGKVTQKTSGIIWFVPGVGLVRYRESTLSSENATEQLLQLKSHSLK